MTIVISVAGGKGGVGKTLVAVNLAHVLYGMGYRVLLIDADVENPSVEALARLRVTGETVSRSFTPSIDHSLCTLCGVCSSYCPEHALVVIPGKKLVFSETLCSGCGVCRIVCPAKAIRAGSRVEGRFRYGSIGEGFDAIIGVLEPGNRRGGVLIVKLIEGHRRVFNSYDYVVIDSPPGTGAGVYAAIRYADVVAAVTEPTPLGASDLGRFIRLLDEHGLKPRVIVVVNKVGLPGGAYSDVARLIRERRLDSVEIPYTEEVARAYSRGRVIAVENPESPVSRGIRRLAALVTSLKQPENL